MLEKIVSNKLLISLAIFLLCLGIYGPNFSNPFSHLDDYEQVVTNRAIQGLDLHHILEIFSKTTVGMYQPISSLLYALAFALVGLEPIAYHILGFLFHLFNCFLLFQLLKKFPFHPKVNLLLVFLFALHPMQVEAVAWISAFSTLSSTAFVFMAVLQYLKFKETGRIKHYYFCFTLFVLACLSKSAAIVFPLYLLCFDFFYFSERSFKKLADKIPFFLVSLIFGLITLFSRESAGHLSDLSITYSLIDRFFIICHNLLFYPAKFLMPAKLSAFYPFPELSNGFLPWDYYAAALLIVLLIFMLWKTKPSKLILLGISYYLTSVLLIAQIIPLGNQIAADRYLYPALFGLLISLGYLLHKIQFKKGFNLLFLLPLIFSLFSFQRAKIWGSDEVLWNDVLNKYPNVAQAHNNLGSISMEKKQPNAALAHFNQAISIKPYYADAYSNRGSVFSGLGNSEKAIRDFDQAIKLRPHADAYFNRANEYAKNKKFNLAIADFKSSLQLKQSADAYTNRAFAHAQLKQVTPAMNDLQKAIELNPNFSQAYFLRAMINQSLGKQQACCADLKKAANLNDDKAKSALRRFCE